MREREREREREGRERVKEKETDREKEERERPAEILSDRGGLVGTRTEAPLPLKSLGMEVPHSPGGETPPPRPAPRRPPSLPPDPPWTYRAGRGGNGPCPPTRFLIGNLSTKISKAGFPLPGLPG